MRKEFLQAYNDLENLNNYNEVMVMNPISAQERHCQTLGNILLCNDKKPTNKIQRLLITYKGTYSHLILTIKYCSYCIQKQLSKKYTQFSLLRMLANWVEIYEKIKKKKDIRLYSQVISTLQLGICSYQQFIAYLNYISPNLTNLIKSGTEQTKISYPDLTHYPHLDSHDLIKFLNVILPKVLVNITVPRHFFPATLLKNREENVHILYSNQTLQNLVQNKSHYNLLLRTIMKTLLSMQLEPGQIRQLILNSFKYYYLFHHDKNYLASQFVDKSLKKLTSAIRFAISDEISLFIITLNKLGKYIFIKYLTEKFQWVNQLKNNTISGISKQVIKPFSNQSFQNVRRMIIEAGNMKYHYVQIYDRFSLLYFRSYCQEYDITIRFYYLGPFNKEGGGIEEKKILFTSEKQEKQYEGSIEIVEKGIYVFEFDNSHSWLKAKTVSFDMVVFVPLEIKDQQKCEIKKYIFEKQEHLNEVLPQNILGWADQQEIKMDSMSGNISCSVEENVKVYELKLVKNTGEIYQYETEIKQRLIKKLKYFENDQKIFWLIEGCKVKNIQQIYQWIHSQQEYQKKYILSKKEKDIEDKMMEEQINQEINQGYDQLQQTSKQQQKKVSQEKSQSTLLTNEDKEEKVSALEEKKQAKIKQQVKDQQINKGKEESNAKNEQKIEKQAVDDGEKTKKVENEKQNDREHNLTKDQLQV